MVFKQQEEQEGGVLGKDQNQKNPCGRKISCPQLWGQKWLRQFYGRLEKMRSFGRKTSMSIKFLVLRGGGYFGFWVSIKGVSMIRAISESFS